jgi:predicted MFS family arabinose efflux permease
MMGMAVLGNIATFATLGVVVLFAERNLGVTPSVFGLLMMGAGVGGLAGGLGAARVERAIGARGIGVGCGLGSAAAFLALATTSSPVVFALAISAIAGVTAAWCVVAVSIRQRIVPDELRGRVGATYRAVAWAGMPVGTLLGGFLAHGAGLRSAFWLSAVLSLGICAIALSRSFRIEPAHSKSDAKRSAGAVVSPVPAAG